MSSDSVHDIRTISEIYGEAAEGAKQPYMLRKKRSCSLGKSIGRETSEQRENLEARKDNDI